MKYKDWLAEWLELYVKSTAKESAYKKYKKQVESHKKIESLKDLEREMKYLIKYITKTGNKLVYSKGMFTYMKSDVITKRVRRKILGVCKRVSANPKISALSSGSLFRCFLFPKKSLLYKSFSGALFIDWFISSVNLKARTCSAAKRRSRIIQVRA